MIPAGVPASCQKHSAIIWANMYRKTTRAIFGPSVSLRDLMEEIMNIRNIILPITVQNPVQQTLVFCPTITVKESLVLFLRHVR